MDLHRVRFVPYPATAINAVAFSREALGSKTSAPVRLAIGRANGDIELWNPMGAVWHQEFMIKGGQNRSVDGLVWVTEDDEDLGNGKIIPGKSRLFSTGYTNTVTEWDLEKGVAKKHASGQHGDIWCLAAQPLSDNGKGDEKRRLVSGTVDGSLILYDIENDDLRLQRVLARTKTKKIKMVSLTFQSRHIVVVGCSDSTIRLYDVRNGQFIRHMTLGSDLSGGSKDIIVWCVKSLPNGDIVSGDSTGQICIWDGKTFTQAQKIKSHTQDVLSLAINAKGTKVVSGGMDRRTVLYEPMRGSKGRWTKVWHRRYHRHDVKAMASFEGRGMSVVVSGGPDAAPVVCPIRGAGREEHRTLSHLPQTTPVLSAPKARLVISWWDREIHIWELRKPAIELVGADEDTRDVNRKLLGRILIQGESNITSASISHDGTLLVVSTIAEVKAFHLRLQHGVHRNELKIKTESVAGNTGGATKVQISPDKSWVCWIEEGSRVVLGQVTSSQSEGSTYSINRFSRLNRLERNFPENPRLGGFGSYQRNITQIAFSPDSKMLAVADLDGFIDTWVLRGPEDGDISSQAVKDDDASSVSSNDSDDEEDDGHGHRWLRNPNGSLIPRLPAAVTVLSFSPDTPSKQGDDYTLLVITATSELLVFNPSRGSLSEWSRANPSSRLPEQFRVTKDLVKGVLWQGPRAFLYGASFLFMMDFSQHFLVDKVSEILNGETKGVKRKREGPNSGAGDRMKKHALAPHTIKTAVGASEEPDWMDVENADAEEEKSLGGDDEDEEDERDDGERQHLRDSQAAANRGSTEKSPSQRLGWWHTYKYRPILGVVPLWSESQEAKDLAEGQDLPPLEVALVERPIWDEDLPPRYE